MLFNLVCLRTLSKSHFKIFSGCIYGTNPALSACLFSDRTGVYLGSKLNHAQLTLSKNFSQSSIKHQIVKNKEAEKDNESENVDVATQNNEGAANKEAFDTVKQSIMAEMRWHTGADFKYKQRDLQSKAVSLYLVLMRQVDHDLFLTDFKMPDTFNSWFKVTELHMWLICLRLASEGDDGKFLARELLKQMWHDVEERIKLLGHIRSDIKKESLNNIFIGFREALFMYDEGILGDDKQLANAIWLTFFEKQCDDPRHIELLVRYVRKQALYMSLNKSESIIGEGIIMLLPLYKDKLDKAQFERMLNELFSDTRGHAGGLKSFKHLMDSIKTKVAKGVEDSPPKTLK